MNFTKEKKILDVKSLCFSAILIAISVILANFPIFSSIALDSMPAFVGGIIISPVVGGIIGLLAHLFVALRTGFPLSLPVHILVALEMFVVVYITSIIFNRGKVILAGIVGTLLNGIGFTFITGVFMYFVLGGMNPVDFLKLLGLPLTLASLVNIVIAFIVSKGLKNANIQV
ncbi:ECF transporter S component [Clostridium perfringens]|uniref:ECF transporter S component n=1 Tax=Clostridium perfringens TaxID=1502 RepID=UPI0013E2AC04|nr:ECF transporter S component [Clostridium perfringens]NGU66764.1 ECF transporter S component [Clostridium perfringens]